MLSIVMQLGSSAKNDNLDISTVGNVLLLVNVYICCVFAVNDKPEWSWINILSSSL